MINSEEILRLTIMKSIKYSVQRTRPNKINGNFWTDLQGKNYVYIL